jgi:hypothetical protein
MRKVVLVMNTTLNGKVDDLFAWFDGVTDDLYAEIDRGLASFDTVLVGRVSYAGMSCTRWSLLARPGSTRSRTSVACS